MSKIDLDAIKKRVQALPNSECKWKRDGLTVLDIRDRPVLEITSFSRPGEVADFCGHAPEDIGLLLREVERLRDALEALHMHAEEIGLAVPAPEALRESEA